jgi:O-antigen ligase
MSSQSLDTRLNRFILAGAAVAALLVVSFAIARLGLLVMAGLMALPIGLGMIYLVIRKASLGLWLSLQMAFAAIGLTRFVPGPLGLSVDVLLALTVLGIFFNLRDHLPIRLRNPIMVIILAWFFFTIFQLFNPEARSMTAWFYAVRGVSFYLLATVPLAMILFRQRTDLRLFLMLWLGWSVVAAFYGMKQLYIGLNAAENAWLAAGNASTHILHGKLRVFSFYSDAGQFGAAMAHAFLVAGILTLGATKLKHRLLLGLVSLVCLWGMMISGTRGALFVPASGFFLYFLLSKNFKILTLGIVMAGSCFFVLKYTYIGQGNYQIQRMRSALDPDDPSLQVRLENQRKMSVYLADRPLGGGIGSSGYWGLRFSPNTFLAQTPSDSWYVKIWAETGIVGLSLHIMMLLGILAICIRRVWQVREAWLRQIGLALVSGMFGIMLASYGNQVLGQNPTGMLIYLSIAFSYMLPTWDSEKDRHESVQAKQKWYVISA